MGNKIDRTGQVVGWLTVVRENGLSKDRHVLWLCKCRCGSEVTVSSNHLKKEDTISCGCFQRECAAKRMTEHGAEWRTKHGLYVSHSRLFKAIHSHFWYIKNSVRCYAGWQIDSRYTLDTAGESKFCEDLIALQPDECERYEKDKSLEIDKDNDGDRIFRPESVVFVSRTENLNNRKCTLRLEDGTPLVMFCSKVGIKTCENGRPTKQYARIRDMYRYKGSHKAHPELVQKANELIALYTKTLKMVKLLADARQFASASDVQKLLQTSSPESV